MVYIPLPKAVEFLGLHPNTLRRYADEGKIKSIKTQQDKDCMTSNHTLGIQPTQKQKSSKTSDQDSTSKEKVCVPYWTDFCQEISSSLLLPVETGLQDLDLNLYNTWSNKTVDKSWFSTKLYTVCNQNLPKIYSQSFTSFPVECRTGENTLKKSKKIYLKLSLAQKRKIKYWFGVSRFAYNETIRYLQTPETKANWKGIKTGIIQGLPEWCKDAPY